MTPKSTWRMAVVGWPLGHSLSPALWEGMGRRRGIAIEYAACPVAPGAHELWGALWASELDAFHVTSPYKEPATRLCNRLSPAAERIAAVNTVLSTPEGWAGHSTDGYGFARSLLDAGEPLRGRTVAVLGTGGAGRAVARTAADTGASVTLVSRDPSRRAFGCEDCERVAWENLGWPFDILVNATPLGRGGSPPPALPYERLCHDAVAVDLNYSPPVTPFLARARDAGARTLNGLGMLIHQACLGAALLFEGDPAAAESYEEDFWAAARRAHPLRSA